MKQIRKTLVRTLDSLGVKRPLKAGLNRMLDDSSIPSEAEMGQWLPAVDIRHRPVTAMFQKGQQITSVAGNRMWGSKAHIGKLLKIACDALF